MLGIVSAIFSGSAVMPCQFHSIVVFLPSFDFLSSRKWNIYWDCYTGFSSAKIREHDKENDYSFEKIEQIYYFETQYEVTRSITSLGNGCRP